ncbi:MAG: hypothetical protein H7249_12925 [Chitinophagaceae bacterium]|nr:hypothetical protein [Oligoflexus sp.]
MRRANFAPLLCFFILIGCSKMCSSGREDMTPEQVVQTYLDISLNMTKVEQKQDLMKLTTGNLKNALVQAPDDIISAAFIKQNYKLERYSVVERRDRTPRETEITFLLTYRNLGPDKNANADTAPKTTTENTLSVVKEDKAWYIRDVIGKKTSIDFLLDEEVKAKPGPGIDEPPPSEEAAPAEETIPAEGGVTTPPPAP